MFAGQLPLNGRFRILPKAKVLKGNNAVVRFAVDEGGDHEPGEETDGKEVAVKLYYDKKLRDESVEAMKKLRNSSFVITFGDPDNVRSCIFDVPPESPESQPLYAVVLQFAKMSLEEIFLKTPDKRWPVDDIISTFRKICQAVAYLHEQGLVHGDVKPGNIVTVEDLGTTGYKLIDFDGVREPGQDMQACSPAICAPEVARELAKGGRAKACFAVDSWALGCIGFRFVEGKSLAHVLTGKPETAPKEEVYEALAGVTQDQVEALARGIAQSSNDGHYKNIASLLHKLLKVDPQERLSASMALGHKLFHGGLTETYDTTKKMLATLLAQSEETRNLVVAGHKLAFQLTEIECPRTFVIVPEEPRKVKDWLKRLCDWFTAPPSEKDLVTTIMGLLSVTRFRLFLVCEFTNERQGEGYPIKQQREAVAKLMAKLMPAMQVAFKLLMLTNSVAKIAKCFFSVPTIPDGAMDSLTKAMQVLDKKSSVEDFACVQAGVDVSDGLPSDPKQQVGASIRVLRNFLKEVDPFDDWAGLERYQTKDGRVLWVSEGAVAHMQEKLKAEGAPPSCGQSPASPAVQASPASTSSSPTCSSEVFRDSMNRCAASTASSLPSPPACPLTQAQVEQLMQSIQDGDLTAVERQLSQLGRAAVSADMGGSTPLHVASEYGCDEVVKLLLGQGADVKATDALGRTPLHLASANGRVDVMKLLIKACKSHIDARDKAGRTPLHHATLGRRKEAVKLLVKLKADEGIKDNAGKTALDLADRSKQKDLVDILKR